MEQMLETIDLDVEENNELLFKVKIEGADRSPSKVRLVCESGDLGFTFNGRASADDLVQFNLPIMKDKLKEGLYQARVEVLIENRYFAPVQFQVNFKRTIKVVAEAVNMTSHKVTPEIRVSAIPVIKQPTLPIQRDVEYAITPRQAPPLAKINSQVTLKERYHTKKDELIEEQIDEKTILDAAKLFVKEHRKNER